MRNRFLMRTCLTGTAALLFALPALATIFKTEPAKSTVSIVFKQLNVPVEAKFRKFTAQIDFDSAKPETSKAHIEIDIASFDLGDPEYNKEVQKKEWFNGSQFPKATFISKTLKPDVNGTFNVTGKLTIKGHTADVSFPLTTKKEGAYQVFEGTLPIKRLAFHIGEGEWKDTGMVADEVVIKFHITATR